MSGDEMLSGWMSYLPLVGALLLVVVGWVLGRIARQAVVTGVPWVNRMSLRRGARPGVLLTPAFARALQILVFWGILLTSVFVALQLIGGGGPGQWLDVLISISSQLLITLAILAIGHILGILARNLVSRLSDPSGQSVLPWVAYGFVISIAAMTALRNLGLDLTFITQILLAVFSIVLAGLGLAFALGARTLVENLVAQGELQRYRTGDRLLVNGIEGTVQEIHRTGLVLLTSKGLANIPAARFAKAVIIKPLPDSCEDE